jgi:hypothetical protein
MGALFGPYCAFCTPLSEQPRRSIASWINALDDLRHNLAKVEVASSSLVSRSKLILGNKAQGHGDKHPDAEKPPASAFMVDVRQSHPKTK